MIETIDRIMDRLAHRGQPFGAGWRRRNRRGEDELQAAMYDTLIAEGHPTCRELVFESFCFMNKRKLKLDLSVGGFGIEVKHVANGPSGRPSDG